MAQNRIDDPESHLPRKNRKDELTPLSPSKVESSVQRFPSPLHLPVGFLQRGGRDCQCQQHYQRRRWRRKRRHRKPTPVDAYGDHDMVCPLGNPHARHASVQSTYVRVGQDAGLFPRRTTVRELRRPGETGQKQADVAIDN
eukprot:COSAG06_NODE_31319_length_523_cov_1.139151_1_plen_140_part_10